MLKCINPVTYHMMFNTNKIFYNPRIFFCEMQTKTLSLILKY